MLEYFINNDTSTFDPYSIQGNGHTLITDAKHKKMLTYLQNKDNGTFNQIE